MADIFISYASEDRERIVPIVKALAAEGWSAFWDWESIPVGKSWREVIDEGLEASKCILVLWSLISTTKKKRWVLEEADYGLEHAKLIPAFIDDVHPPRGFGQIQAARLIDWNGDINHPDFKKLVNALQTILGPSPKRVGESERAGKIQEEQGPDPLRHSHEVATPAEAARASGPPDTPNPSPRKSLIARIGLWGGLAAVVFAGALLVLWPETQEPAGSAGIAVVPAGQPQPVAVNSSGKSPPKKITNAIGMEFLLIPAGSFTMGSRLSPKQLLDRLGGNEEWYQFEQPPQAIKISEPYYLQATEVTQGQWKRVMGENPSYFAACGDDCPVESVSWEDARNFIDQLNQLEQTNSYRLPSEAEWEYAGRAGTAADYSFGDDAGKLEDYAWFAGNSNKTTQRVAGKKPNPRGLYDMHGNVAEWVEDDWHGSHQEAPADGRAWVDAPRGSDRVVRGCGWGGEAQRCRSAGRAGFWIDCRDDGIGFRLVKSVAQGP
jgi:formylglycine-generating enzyme required for sulfatase activity